MFAPLWLGVLEVLEHAQPHDFAQAAPIAPCTLSQLIEELAVEFRGDRLHEFVHSLLQTRKETRAPFEVLRVSLVRRIYDDVGR
jgi:hypothetical protein